MPRILCSLPCSQKPATCPYPKGNPSSPRPLPGDSFNIHFNIILPSRPRYSFPQVSRPPLILTLCTRCNSFVRFTPRPLYLHANKLRHPLNRRFGGARRCCACFWWREISLYPPPPPHYNHHHHTFKDWGLVARSSLNISLCNGCTVFVLPAGWFYNTACGSLCPPSLLTRCTHLLSQLLNCTKTTRISNSFKMAHYLKQMTSLCVHHSGVVLLSRLRNADENRHGDGG